MRNIMNVLATLKLTTAIKPTTQPVIVQKRNKLISKLTEVIELAKGKNAVELASKADLITTLETLKEAVLAGELDVQIEAASGAIRSKFKVLSGI
jgi:hypothetical protein